MLRYLVLIVLTSVPHSFAINHNCDGKCDNFCDCIDQITPDNMVSIEKLEKTHRKCGKDLSFGESSEFWGDEFQSETYEKGYRDLADCLMPTCTKCQNKLEKLLGIDEIKPSRLARSIKRRMKRQAEEQQSRSSSSSSRSRGRKSKSRSASEDKDTIDWDTMINSYDKCVAEELGMKLDQYRLYEAHLEIAEGGITTCYLYGCKQKFGQFVTTMRDCKVNKTITEDVLDFMG